MSGNHGPASKHSGWVKSVESQVAVTDAGVLQRVLIITVKGVAGRLWILGPDVEMPGVTPALRTVSDVHFDEVAAALHMAGVSVTWWRQGSRILSLVITSSWEVVQASRSATGAVIGAPG